jgi:hypothetical protein
VAFLGVGSGNITRPKRVDMRTVLFALLTLILLSPVALADAGRSHDVTITLERTTCFGTCPAYSLTIEGDGKVTYEGKDFVRVKGVQHSKLDEAAVEKLVQAFLDVHYFDLLDDYETFKGPDGVERTEPGDAPTFYTSLRIADRSKKIKDHLGAPKALSELEDKIDAIVGSKRWISIDAATVHDQARHGWNANGPDGKRLFLEAVYGGDEEVVRAFIQEKVDVNTGAPIQFARGSTIVKLLIAAGANVNPPATQSMIGSPLAFAARLGDIESIKMLLDSGAKVNAVSTENVTALMWAAQSGNPEAVRTLLAAGADASIRTKSGWSAMFYVDEGVRTQDFFSKMGDPDGYRLPQSNVIPNYEAKYQEIRRLLISAGAKDEHLPDH